LLLAASGEMSDAARREVLAHVAQDPELNADYQEIREGMELLGNLPIPEPSAAERKEIPATIKKAVHQALQQKGARRWLTRGGYAVSAIAAALLVMIGAGTFAHERALTSEERSRMSRLQNSIATLEARTSPASVPLALTNVPVPASMPSLANLHESEWAVPVLWNGSELFEEEMSEPSSPPGSY
jgi:anti-sigma factor RsiW